MIKQMTTGKLNPQQRSYLTRIGLSKEAIRLYNQLLKQGPLSARTSAQQTATFPSAQYRLFYELEAQQLVRRLPGRPRRFQALALSDGLQASYLNQTKQLRQLSGQPPLDDSVNIIAGRQAVYQAYLQRAKTARQQISIYAIGIAYSETYLKRQAAAVARGVRIRHVVQEVKPSNFYIIDRLLQLGIEMRTLKRPRGYHLSIIDDGYALVTFSNPQDTEQRFTLVTTDPPTVAIFQTQFETIWQAARPLV